MPQPQLQGAIYAGQRKKIVELLEMLNYHEGTFDMKVSILLCRDVRLSQLTAMQASQIIELLNKEISRST